MIPRVGSSFWVILPSWTGVWPFGWVWDRTPAPTAKRHKHRKSDGLLDIKGEITFSESCFDVAMGQQATDNRQIIRYSQSLQLMQLVCVSVWLQMSGISFGKRRSDLIFPPNKDENRWLKKLKLSWFH